MNKPDTPATARLRLHVLRMVLSPRTTRTALLRIREACEVGRKEASEIDRKIAEERQAGK